MISFLKKIIDKRVDERINEVIQNNEDFSLRTILDSQARREISSFILEKKKKGITKLSVLDFVLNLKLPADQISRILGSFQKEKKVKEIDGE